MPSAGIIRCRSCWDVVAARAHDLAVGLFRQAESKTVIGENRSGAYTLVREHRKRSRLPFAGRHHEKEVVGVTRIELVTLRV